MNYYRRRRGNDDDPSHFDANRVAILHRDQQQQPGSSTKTATSTVRHRDGNSSDDETVGYDRYHANARSRLYSDDDDRDSGW